LEHRIQSTGQAAVSADVLWTLVRNFHGTWHPAIATMAIEHDEAGRKIRAFTVHNENKTYREQLTWFSDSEKSLAYTHVDGIDGVDQYHAKLYVNANENGSTISMQADLSAPEPRATEIANGTQVIFDSAIDAITTIANEYIGNNSVDNPDYTPSQSCESGATINTRLINNVLAVSYVDGPTTRSNTLCLFIHGIGGSRHNWQNQLAAVAPYCTAAALDLRGYGDSKPGEKQSTVDDYCNDILSVADAFDADKLILCGLSYGAWIATSFSLRHQNRLSALILSGGCTGMSEASVDKREAFRQSRQAPLNEGKTPADFAPNVLAILAGPDITESVKQELFDSMSAISAKTYLDALHCFTNPTETFDFSNILVPVLLMTGDADKLAPPEELNQVAQRIYHASANPDVRFECLPRTGHVCNLESPDAYNAPLLELIRRVVR